jgi:hypothetical protein
MADTEELHEVPAVHTNAIGTPAVGGTEPTRPKLIFRITSMTRPVTAAQSRTQVERTNSAPRHDERADYVTGQALVHLTASVKNGQAHDVVPAGVDRFFMTRVTAITGRNAVVATCDDGSKFREESPRTGKVDTSFLAPPGQQYLFETWRMVRLSGHWAITALAVASLPSPSAEPCQPGMAGSGPSRRPDVAVALREMSTAVRTASSVHLSGTIQQGGKTVGVNLGITRSGEFSGQITEYGAVFTVLATHGHSYLKLSAAFLRIAHLPATACSTFCGRYLEYSKAQSQQLVSGLSMARRPGRSSTWGR